MLATPDKTRHSSGSRTADRLDLALAGSQKVGVLVSPGVRIITFGMRGAERVTLLGRCERHERIEHLRMRFRIGPILRNAGPLGAQALLIRVGILDDERLQPFPMRRDDAKADRPAIIMKVEGVLVDLELLEKSVDRLGPSCQKCMHTTTVAGRHSDRILENPALSDDSVWPARG